MLRLMSGRNAGMRLLYNYLDKLGVVRVEDPSPGCRVSPSTWFTVADRKGQQRSSPLTDLSLRSTSARTARLTEEPELIIVLFGPDQDLPLKVRRVDQVKVA